MKTILLVCFFAIQVEARDLFELTRNSFLDETESETKLRTGAPPLQVTDEIRMINSVTYSEHAIDYLSFEDNQKLKLKELVWSP